VKLLKGPLLAGALRGAYSGLILLLVSQDRQSGDPAEMVAVTGHKRFACFECRRPSGSMRYEGRGKSTHTCCLWRA
jgi:hypothetical protein